MIPNRFPDATGAPEYNTVDATLWIFDAVHRYVEATGDEGLLADLFPVLERILRHHQDGTRYGIHVDPDDGLLHAGEAGVQLTWMDAKVDDWVVTPRIGKPVEVNALWHHALRVMKGFADRLGRETARSFLRPLLRHLGDHGLGHISEIFDGDPPFTPRGTIAQAWSVAEVLDAWRMCDRHARNGQ